MKIFHSDDNHLALAVRDYLREQGIDSDIRIEETSYHPYGVWLVSDADTEKAQIALKKLFDTPNCAHLLREAAWQQNSLEKLTSVTPTFSYSDVRTNTPLSLFISLLCIAVFVIWKFTDQGAQKPVFDFMQFDATKIKEQWQLWRLITPCFMHFSFMHIAFNLVIFVTFAKLIERYLGFTKLLLLMIVSGVFGNIVQYWVNDFHGNFGGLSGVVDATIAYVTIVSRVNPLPAQFKAVPGMFLVSVIFIIIGLIFDTNTAEGCHITGIVVGLLMGTCDYFALVGNRLHFKQ